MVKYNLSLYVNKFVKIVLEKNKEVPYVYGNLVGYLRYDEKFKMYLINHPYNLSSGKCDCGEAAFDPNDIKDIKPATDNERKLWACEYIKFHSACVKAKGRDECKLDLPLDEILPSLKLTMK